ncbi:MAG: hypothetical protein JWN25_2105 [Verrucomicrobiales bacterium]|nr:hypothetical protein [Verrucomicrobiales bacterium]
MCAICGRHNPQLHHMDKNPENNEPLNILPLCPNCHLQDVHNPTSAPDYGKLRLFRVYKDPLILDPRFHPIYRRMKCLHDPKKSEQPNLFVYRLNDLIEFIECFRMGSFYKRKILTMINKPYNFYYGKGSSRALRMRCLQPASLTHSTRWQTTITGRAKR